MINSISSVDPDGLLEYSVVFTDRSLNHMSEPFQEVMRDISRTLKKVYHAKSVAIVPGGGTYAMEAVSRQFASDKKCLIVRNGWFSYRWTQIFEVGNIPSEQIVFKARLIEEGNQAAFAPPPVEEIVSAIKSENCEVVFAPHVETSSGIILPDDYLRSIAEAVHSVGGLFVLDCIASGAVWVDMEDIGIDILISAPQKGWSASPCGGIVTLSALARDRIDETTSSSFSCDLKKWLQIMEAYENGGHAYHATMPTDALVKFRDAMIETERYGFEKVRNEQLELGKKVRSLLIRKGFRSVAAEGYEAPGVVVSYTDNPNIHNGKLFAELGMQIAAGVPLQCDEPEDYQTFRLGLFGLDKLHNIDRTVNNLETVLDKIV